MVIQVEGEVVEQRGDAFGGDVHSEELAGDRGGGNRNSQETEIVLVESIQSQFIAFCIRAHEGKLGQGAGAGSLESRKIEVATGTGHDERNLRASHKAGIAF